MFTALIFTTAGSRQWSHVGPLADYLDGFAAALLAEGYARASVGAKLRLIKRLSCWLKGKGLDVDELDEARFESFLFSERLFRGWGHRATGQQFLTHLRQKGRISQAPGVAGPTSPAQRIEHRYQRSLLDERGLAPTTVKAYSCVVRAFLAERFSDGAVSLAMAPCRWSG